MGKKKEKDLSVHARPPVGEAFLARNRPGELRRLPAFSSL